MKDKYQETYINPTLCAHSALVFLTQGKQMLELQSKDGLSFFRYYVAPCVVNLAFSCELYLKALRAMANNGRIEKTHYLVDLFNQINPTTQTEIIQEYNKLSPQKPLSECLTLHNDAFLVWRYHFEINGKEKRFDPLSLFNFAVSLNHVYCSKE